MDLSGGGAGGGAETSTWLEFLTAISSKSLAPGHPDSTDALNVAAAAAANVGSAGGGGTSDPLGFLFGHGASGAENNPSAQEHEQDREHDGNDRQKRARRERDEGGLDFALDDYSGGGRASARLVPVSPPESGGRDDGGGGAGSGGAMDDGGSQSGSDYAPAPVDAGRARAKRVRTH